MAHELQAEQAIAAARFGDRVAEAVERKRSQLLVGLDPRPDLLPVELRGDAHLGREHAAQAFARFCRGLVDAVAPYVVGVKPQLAIGEARRALPQSILLLPGVGAQGATPADVARAFASGPASALVNVSRSVIYAYRAAGGDWRSAAGAEAARVRRDVWTVAGW